MKVRSFTSLDSIFFNLSSMLIPFFGLISKKISRTSHDRNNFSVSTFPINPVPPVTRILLPAKNAGMEFSGVSPIFICKYTKSLFFHITLIVHMFVLSALIKLRDERTREEFKKTLTRNQILWILNNCKNCKKSLFWTNYCLTNFDFFLFFNVRSDADDCKTCNELCTRRSAGNDAPTLVYFGIKSARFKYESIDFDRIH